MISIPLIRDSRFYRHCKVRRTAKELMCGECPFKEYIEDMEGIWIEHDKLEDINGKNKRSK